MGAAEQQTKAQASIQSLKERVDGYIAQERFRSAAWGIEVRSLESGAIVYEHNAHKLLKPASNTKLYTGALALDRFGPDFRIKTSVYSAFKPNEQGELAGDLIIYGRGDPSFAIRFTNVTSQTLLDPLAEAIANAGIKHVKGGLVGDETFFSGPPFGAEWTWDDLQYYYGAEVSSLTVQDNVVDLAIKPGGTEDDPCMIVPSPEMTPLHFVNRTRTVGEKGKRAIEIYRPLMETNVYVTGTLPLKGSTWSDSVSVPQPGSWFLMLLRDALAQRGITAEGESKLVHWPETETSQSTNLNELAAVESRPLSEIVTRMMKPSQNLYAHLLLLQVGASATNPPAGKTTEELGLRELKKFLHKAGVPEGEALLEEGSGLSRGCLVTAHATAQLLVQMRKHRTGDLFYDALPIAGVDGSLKSRLKDFKGNVHAKTGSIRYVNTLSGYAQSGAGEPLVFSLMLNAYAGAEGAPNPKDDLDQIVRWIAELSERSSTKP